MSDSGTTDKIKGTIKEAAGKVTGDKDTELEGKAEKAKGAVKETAEKVKDVAEDTAQKVKEKVDDADEKPKV